MKTVDDITAREVVEVISCMRAAVEKLADEANTNGRIDLARQYRLQAITHAGTLEMIEMRLGVKL